MKSQKFDNKLKFDKHAVTELNDQKLLDINGGTSPLAISIIMLSVSLAIDAYNEE
ncbi:class I lanthipeptide [Aquimarina sp. U1-2]|uniref:class I lanthipeptide n=1 Tax=Aquimarina sp. U1-2 TaxID=2823141 RepID=UPI001AECBFB2|nr:class I lanthipeptide [Aquimarina sp. U1-2]MBP2833386.1 class I lanthipeptide [Aquimarina sp. U1-2]